MSLRITVRDDFDRLAATLTRAEREQLPYATALALNATIRQVKTDLQDGMRAAFDRPTPFTLRSLYVETATKRDPSANVHFKDFAMKGTAAGRYLRAQIESGPRRAKSSERQMRAAGILPQNRVLLPAKGAELDGYGNVSRAQMVKVMSAVRGFASAGYSANAGLGKSRGKRRKEDYFAVKPGHKGGLPAGIYRRTPQGGHIMVFIFGKEPTYRSRFDFEGIAAASIRRNLGPNLIPALERAMRTSKR